MIDHKIALVCAQTLSAPIPAMISEVTVEFTKLAAFNNFPHMFLRPQNYAQNIFERDLDLVHKFDGQVTGRDQHMNQEKIDSYD